MASPYLWLDARGECTVGIVSLITQQIVAWRWEEVRQLAGKGQTFEVSTELFEEYAYFYPREPIAFIIAMVVNGDYMITLSHDIWQEMKAFGYWDSENEGVSFKAIKRLQDFRFYIPDNGGEVRCIPW